MATRRRPAVADPLAHYLLCDADRAMLIDAVLTEIHGQQKDGTLAIIRGRVSAERLAGAIADAVCERKLAIEPYEPIT